LVGALVFTYLAIQYAQSRGVDTTPAPASPAVVAPSPPNSPPPSPSAPSVSNDASIERAYAEHARDVPVAGEGVVLRLLPDDTQGDRHQRFLVRLPSGQSLLIVHNIDIAPRVRNLTVGNAIQFAGEFVWNEKGGLVHWTHHDPSARHKAGWLRYADRTYQ
jgi:hypothetical protein